MKHRSRPQAVGLGFLKFHDGHEFHESSRMKTSLEDSCKFVRFVAELFVDYGGGDRVSGVNF